MSKKVKLRVVGGGVMADDKKKTKRNFNWQSLKEAVERMQPELAAASEAAHKDGADDTPEDSDFDRSVALAGFRGVVLSIPNAPWSSDHGEKTPHHHH